MSAEIFLVHQRLHEGRQDREHHHLQAEQNE